MIYTIKQVQDGRPDTYTQGNTSYGVTLQNAQGDIYSTFLSLPSSTAPAVNSTVEGTVELKTSAKGTQYYKFTDANAPRKSGGGYQRPPEEPEKQKMIVRQNALGNAVQFQYNLAVLQDKPEIYTTDNVLLVASKFMRFSLGDLTPRQQDPPPDEFSEGI